jgi:hypothetical protein
MPGQFVLTPKNRMLRVGGSRVSRTGREESRPLSGPRQIAVRIMYKTPAENEQRAKPYQEHSRLSIHRCPAQQNWNQSREGRIRSGRNKFQKLELVSGPCRSVACTALCPHPAERCQCPVLKGPRTFQCFDCDRPDPMKTEKATGGAGCSGNARQ